MSETNTVRWFRDTKNGNTFASPCVEIINSWLSVRAFEEVANAAGDPLPQPATDLMPFPHTFAAIVAALQLPAAGEVPDEGTYVIAADACELVTDLVSSWFADLQATVTQMMAELENRTTERDTAIQEIKDAGEMDSRFVKLQGTLAEREKEIEKITATNNKMLAVLQRVRQVCKIKTLEHMSYSGERYEIEIDELLKAGTKSEAWQKYDQLRQFKHLVGAVLTRNMIIDLGDSPEVASQKLESLITENQQLRTQLDDYERLRQWLKINYHHEIKGEIFEVVQQLITHSCSVTVDLVQAKEQLEAARRGRDNSPDANVRDVVTKFIDRSQAGLKKYGVTTERTDLSQTQWLQHLQDELMDATVYVQRLLSEQPQPIQQPAKPASDQTSGVRPEQDSAGN